MLPCNKLLFPFPNEETAGRNTTKDHGDHTYARTSHGYVAPQEVPEHRYNYPLDNAVPAQDSGTDAAPQTPSILEPTYIRYFLKAVPPWQNAME
ncbi:hypothetical protein HPB52_002246 [Rhipicephalus sanguineus]|uniref:Uncharacterized protein n=1 Tax=Rhipicephalus sanguineus TaxID=34632 RepID=A0A9D4QBT9_RHISA|nr:hypothetical protein HPB52_002246 [Rhipicephalus sanguineus]